MRTAYSVVGDNGMQEFLLREKKEQLQTIVDTINLIIELSGDYLAALEFLKENGIKTRLDSDKLLLDGLPIITQLNELRAAIEGELIN